MAAKAHLGLAACLCGIPCAVAAPAVDLVRIGPGSGALGGSEAVRVSHAALAHTAQVLATDPDGGLVGPGDYAAQVDRALDNLALALAEAGSSLDRIVRLNAVVESVDGAAALARKIEADFRLDSRPAVTLVEGRLPLPGALVALDAVAMAEPASAGGGRPLWLESASLPAAPGATHCAILPAGPRIYVSGRAADGPPADAASDVLRQLEETMAFLGLDVTRVVQVKCFLQPIAATTEVQAWIIRHFGGHAPPTVFVEWQHERTIEIELIAAAEMATAKDPPAIEYLTPPEDRASPVFARVARVSHPGSIFVSTLNGRTDELGEMPIREMFADLTRILKKAGSDLLHLAKATYYVSDDRTSRKLNEIRPEFYDPARPPAASKAPVRGTAVTGRSLAVDMIAVPVP